MVCEHCELADSFAKRLRGLLGRSGLEAGHGLLIRPASSVHMFFMRFAIDAVLLDDDLQVVKVTPALRPWRITAARGARSVLELRAGEAARHGIVAGDVLELRG